MCAVTTIGEVREAVSNRRQRCAALPNQRIHGRHSTQCQGAHHTPSHASHTLVFWRLNEVHERMERYRARGRGHLGAYVRGHEKEARSYTQHDQKHFMPYNERM
jgi:hypothetical protein